MVESNKNLASRTCLKNVKSKYILEIIFDNLQIINFLNIIRYNKYFQNLFEKTKDDYKTNSKIEIEITPLENKYSNFNKIKEEDEYYYHIYFNYINKTK